MVEQDEAALARARAGRSDPRLVGKGRMSEENARAWPAGKRAITYNALDEADLIIEAVFEDMDVKLAVFAELDRVARPGAVLATNTSYLDINRIARHARGRRWACISFAGQHHEAAGGGGGPVDLARHRGHRFRTGAATGQRPCEPASATAIGNRILAVQAADLMMQDGASPYEIDAACAPSAIPWAVPDGRPGWRRHRLGPRNAAPPRDPALRYVRIPDLLCERGWFGQKSGRGFYLYPDGARQGEPDPEVLALIDEERRRAGIAPAFSQDEIQRRYLAAMIKAANVLREGIALRPSDIDVVFLYGYGFPRRGDPMHYADSMGLERVCWPMCARMRQDPVAAAGRAAAGAVSPA